MISMINLVMKKALSKLKEDLTSCVKNEMSHCEKKVNLKTMSKAKLLETKNLRDNVKILGLSETLLTKGDDGNNKETSC